MVPIPQRQNQGQLSPLGSTSCVVGGPNNVKGSPELCAVFNLFLFSFDYSVGNIKSMCMIFEECDLENSIIECLEGFQRLKCCVKMCKQLLLKLNKCLLHTIKLHCHMVCITPQDTFCFDFF